MLGFDGGIKTTDLIWVESNLCFYPMKYEFHLDMYKNLICASGWEEFNSIKETRLLKMLRDTIIIYCVGHTN
jgi:hypothetical protein